MPDGQFGRFTSDDGESRPFQPDSTDPRVITATVIARRSGWAEIRPGHWAEAGAIVKALKDAGQLVDRRRTAQTTRRTP